MHFRELGRDDLSRGYASDNVDGCREAGNFAEQRMFSAVAASQAASHLFRRTAARVSTMDTARTGRQRRWTNLWLGVRDCIHRCIGNARR